MNQPLSTPLTIKDFSSDQEVRWCPGCGDYAILKTIQKLMPELNRPRENQVFISGIGCSSRFPYYMNTYGFHTIHGRAPAIATGVKIANPELDVWVITGDGDALSIGGNHTIHALRRNVDITMLMFNNEIYGLTKGQYSPTSKVGIRSPSTPDGSIDRPLSPCGIALGAGAPFVARSVDTDMKHLTSMITRAHQHKGASYVEIMQNCPIYNDGFFDDIRHKKTAADFSLVLEHGKPLVFGKDNNKGICLDAATLSLKVVTIGEDCLLDEVLVHDETNKTLAQLLAAMHGPDFPLALGVLYYKPDHDYISDLYAQREKLNKGKEKPDIDKLLHSGHTWQV